jgi:hypothetical protein
MENKFDKDLKQRLGEASLPEAGLRFDKDKLWGKIEKKKAKKRIAFLPWVSHAAAVAAGLAAGIFLFIHKDQPVASPQVAVQQKGITVRDTVYIVKNEKEQTQQPSVLRKAAKAQVPASVTTVQQPLYIATDTEQPEEDAQAVIALNKSVPLKVLHLTDIDNENSKPHIRVREKPSFFVVDRNQAESSPETFSMLIAQKLNLKKN